MVLNVSLQTTGCYWYMNIDYGDGVLTNAINYKLNKLYKIGCKQFVFEVTIFCICRVVYYPSLLRAEVRQ